MPAAGAACRQKGQSHTSWCDSNSDKGCQQATAALPSVFSHPFVLVWALRGRERLERMDKEAAERAAANAIKKKKAEERIASESLGRQAAPYMLPSTVSPAANAVFLRFLLGSKSKILSDAGGVLPGLAAVMAPPGAGFNLHQGTVRAPCGFDLLTYSLYLPSPDALAANETILKQKRTDFETREAASEVGQSEAEGDVLGWDTTQQLIMGWLFHLR